MRVGVQTAFFTLSYPLLCLDRRYGGGYAG